MSGKLLLQARSDAIKFTTSGGFEEDILLKTKDGSMQLAVKGLSSGHTQTLDTDGSPINSESKHVSFPEIYLIQANYPYKSIRTGKIALSGHQVMVKDNTGFEANYVINECHPNATTGLIICILGRVQ